MGYFIGALLGTLLFIAVCTFPLQTIAFCFVILILGVILR